MKLYHFVSEQYGLKNLREKRLKIARIMELNDPFEFLGVDLSNRTFRKAMKDTKKDLSKTKGILCFSKNWNNPVLWGHYADKHKGICLGFDIPDSLVSEVKYTDQRLSYRKQVDEKAMLTYLTTKFSHWSYEAEFRSFLSLDKEIDGHFYADFSENLRLRQVIIGAHSSVSRVQIRDALGEKDGSVEVFKVRAAFRSFKIVRNKNDELWK